MDRIKVEGYLPLLADGEHLGAGGTRLDDNGQISHLVQDLRIIEKPEDSTAIDDQDPGAAEAATLAVALAVVGVAAGAGVAAYRKRGVIRSAIAARFGRGKAASGTPAQIERGSGLREYDPLTDPSISLQQRPE